MRKEDRKAPYPWRGVLIDESRHFFGREEIVRLIGLMHRLGYNRLHWHLSDDQGFRIALKDRPEIKRISTKRDYTLEGCPLGKRTKEEAAYQGFYTENELKEIAGIAASKGIEIVPEIDMPGHMSALLAAYPRFSCGRKPFGVATTWGVFDHPLNIGDPEAVAFAKEIVDEVVAVFNCHHFHLGFDEIRRKALRNDPACRKAIKERRLHGTKGLIADFRGEMADHLLSRGVQPIVWDDEIEAKDERLIVQAWRPFRRGRLKKLAKQGQRLIVSPFFSSYANLPYCLVPLKKTYGFDPRKGLGEGESVLGAEVAYWSEYRSSSDKFDFEFMYRAYAVAKALWGCRDRTYLEFRASLMRAEKKDFGRELAIPLSLTDPKGFSRLKRICRYYRKSTDGEYQDYLSSKE